MFYGFYQLVKSSWWFHFFKYFHQYLGEISNLTNIFQMGWNDQLEIIVLNSRISSNHLADLRYSYYPKFWAIFFTPPKKRSGGSPPWTMGLTQLKPYPRVIQVPSNPCIAGSHRWSLGLKPTTYWILTKPMPTHLTKEIRTKRTWAMSESMRLGRGIKNMFSSKQLDSSVPGSWVVIFQILVIFIPIWGRFPFWRIFFKWVETTNQVSLANESFLNPHPWDEEVYLPWICLIFLWVFM